MERLIDANMFDIKGTTDLIKMEQKSQSLAARANKIKRAKLKRAKGAPLKGITPAGAGKGKWGAGKKIEIPATPEFIRTLKGHLFSSGALATIRYEDDDEEEQ